MEYKPHNSNLRALLSIKNLNHALESHYTQMIQIEKSFDEMNENATSIIESHSPTELKDKWYKTTKNTKRNIDLINTTLQLAKDKIANKDKTNSIDLWKDFDENLKNLKALFKMMEEVGLEILPEDLHLHWKLDVCNFDSVILPLIISHASACKAELELIQKYTPDELDVLTQIILDHLPDDFTFEEADKYEAEYIKALNEFKEEFKEDKNLWDKFLDVLAAGTHQPPSERIMMKRWLDGEKHDL